MKNVFLVAFLFLVSIISTYAQTIKFEGREFEVTNVNASFVELDGEEVLKGVQDLKALPFDLNKLSNTVDEPRYVKVKNLDI